MPGRTKESHESLCHNGSVVPEIQMGTVECKSEASLLERYCTSSIVSSLELYLKFSARQKVHILIFKK